MEYADKNADIGKQTEIGRLINHLDDTMRRFEAEWGAGRLQELAPPGLREKWERQWTKVGEAICSTDVEKMRVMVDGAVRGLQALESAVKAAGGTPLAPEFWEAQEASTGQVYRIAKNREDARYKAPPGVVTYTLEEIVNILHNSSLVEVVKRRMVAQAEKEPVKREAFDFVKGDEMPF